MRKQPIDFPTFWLWAAALPALLVVAFDVIKTDSSIMNHWVFSCIAPVMQWFGQFWSIAPFSVAELLSAAVIVLHVVSIGRGIFLALRSRVLTPVFTRLAALGCLWLWLWSGLCWLWNCTYYAASFSARSGLETAAYSFDTLTAVAVHFAQQAAARSDDVPRDEELHFAQSWEDCLAAAPSVYDSIEQQFPMLELDSVCAKPLLCSRLQSILGFTGVYFPFTGEANVNIDAPTCLLPATIAHEMSHQRMVAAEQEANFVGILACITCEDPVFQYSGYLMGLIHLTNAIAEVSPETVYAIMADTFTPELSTDWNDNYTYWKQFESPAEEKAEQVYDGFLKQNDQALGIRSYGACVDLLVNYFS